MNYKLAENISWRDIQGQILILDPRINQKAHELNPIASYIWTNIADGKTTSTIIDELTHQYEGQELAASIKNQADSFINQLLDLKLINHD